MKAGVVYIFLMFMLSIFTYGQLNLTDEEKKWLAEHPVIKVANEDDWPPFDYSEKGKALGLTISYVDLLFSKLGIQAEYINGYSWNELLEKSKNYQIDLMPCIWYATERTEFLNYTSAYISNPQVIVVNKKNKSITKVSDLKGKKVAFMEDYATTDKILDAYPEIIPVPVKSPLEALLLVNLGSADACIDSIGLVSYQIEKNLLSGLKIAGRLEMDGVENINNLYMAVRKDWPLLHSALQKAMNSLTEEEKLSLHDKWLMKIDSDSKGDFKILESEKSWLGLKEKINFAYVSSLAPIQYKGVSGKFNGITAEYTKEIEQVCETEFSVKAVKGFENGEELLKSGKIDILSTVIDNTNQDFIYTQPFLSVPVVVLTRKGTSLVSNISLLK
ncbi:MAG: transporter substrate-binding domain-containing protein, partial [Lentisphaeraceae bacterium]|nr:transporter substrate-binding domain-containing protein [Lentisphaeraceae bacterium]